MSCQGSWHSRLFFGFGYVSRHILQNRQNGAKSFLLNNFLEKERERKTITKDDILKKMAIIKNIRRIRKKNS